MRFSRIQGCLIIASLALIVTACAAQPTPEPNVPDPPTIEPTVEIVDPTVDLRGSNPIEASAASLEQGGAQYAAFCATCHGDAGAGDGPAAAALTPQPADLAGPEVQANSDDKLFAIISDGVEGTAMPPWGSILSEDDRWHVVNFLRSLAGN